MTWAALLFFSMPCPAQLTGASSSRKAVSELACTVQLGAASKKERVLHFPKDYSLGEIAIVTWPPDLQRKEWRGAARGTVIGPAGKMVRFIPAHRFYKNPELVKTLPADGVDSLVLSASSLDDSEDGLCDSALAHIGYLKNLVELNLDRSDATDVGAVHAAELPNLQKFTALSAPLEGNCFKQFVALKQLNCMQLPRTSIKAENLQYLAVLPNLKSLGLKHSTTSDAGVKYLAACPALYSLNLEDNPQVTDRSVKALASIKTLRVLTLGGTSITFKGILQLRALPLVALQLPCQSMALAQLREIQKAFPRANVVLAHGGKVSVDSETGTIFAPLH